MEYYRRKTPNCAFDLCTQDAPAQHWYKGLHLTGIASTLRASSKTLPGETLDGGPSFGFRRALWVGRANPTQHEQLRANGPSSEWARGRSVVIGTTTAHEALENQPNAATTPAAEGSLSTEYRTEHRLVSGSLQSGVPSSVQRSVSLLSCLFWSVAPPQVCPSPLSRFNHGGGELALADRHWTPQ